MQRGAGGGGELGPAPGRLVLLHKTEYGALISKGDHKKFSPYSSFLLHPGKKEIIGKGLKNEFNFSKVIILSKEYVSAHGKKDQKKKIQKVPSLHRPFMV